MHKGNTNETILKLRPRDSKKEIGAPTFRFKPATSGERIYDAIISKNLGVFEERESMDENVK